MVEKLKKIPSELLKKWKSFNSKQRTIIISAISVIVIAFALLILLMGRTNYTTLRVCSTAEEAAAVAEILKEQGIIYRLEADTVTISVDAKKYSDAFLSLASNDLPSVGLSVDELLNNSLSTTNSDRNLKLNLYLQDQLKKYLETMTGVEGAEVYYIPQDDTNTILATQKQTTASVLLRVNDNFEIKTAETIAEIVASVIGNKTTDNIKVADQNGNLLFGAGKDLYSGSASSTEDYKERLRNTFINNLYMGLIKNGYDDVEIMPNLTFNMDKVSELYTEYLPAEGQEQGLYSHSYTYNSENAGSSGGGVPGTSSNDGTDYMLEDAASSSGVVEIQEYDYLPNTRVTNTEFEIGAIVPEESSISVVLRRVKTQKEEDLELEGKLEEMTFDEYVLQNSDRIKMEVDEDVIDLIAFATGIAKENIKVVSYEQPVFVPKVVVQRDLSDYLQYILAALIIGLILFVVFKGTSPIEVVELEPELSVEQLLATTQDKQVQEIEFNEVSEIRRTIEKFVDEKPDAVAQLLRNWLNEDWE